MESIIDTRFDSQENSWLIEINGEIDLFNSNEIKFSNNNYSFSKPINFKNKSKSEKIPNEEIYTSPSLTFISLAIFLDPLIWY